MTSSASTLDLGKERVTFIERVATWERVSSDGQDTANQTATLEQHCGGHGYDVVKRFVLPDTSAFKGKHQAALDEILRDVAADEYSRIVAVTSSRFERRGVTLTLTFVLELAKLGARLEAADNPLFGDVSNLGGWITTIASGDADNAYSQKISDNVNRTFRRMDGQDAFRGCPPAGYMVTGEKYAMRLVPRQVPGQQEGKRTSRRKGQPKRTRIVIVRLPSAREVADAFDAAVAGTGTTELGRRLGMSADAVGKMLRNTVYSTGRHEVVSHRDCKDAEGRRLPCVTGEPRTEASKCLTVTHRCKALVKPAVQKAAIAALEGRRKGDNVSSRAIAKDDYSGALYCPCGHGVLYRYFGGGRLRTDGTPGPRVRRYQCSANRGGCGKSVRADAADAAVEDVMSANNSWWLDRWLLPGDDYAAELDRVKLEYRELSARGLDFDAEDAERDRLRAEIRRLEALPSTPATWYQGFRQDETGRNLTEADRWASLDSAGRRAWLTGEDIRIYASAAPGRTGAVVVELVHLDADE